MLIFDSGVGGLSILKNIKTILPNIHCVYVLDNQSFPYGNKEKIFILKRSIKIINTIKKTYPIKIVLIACNTASTNTISILRKKFSFPIIGVFPEIKAAKKVTKNNIIGLIATEATINSNYTKKIIQKKFANNITIKIIATNKLAEIAEQKIRAKNTNKKALEKIFKPWTNLVIKPDTIVLGCTHFSFLRTEIQKTLHNSIYFIDSTKTVVSKVKKYFNKFNIHQKIEKNIFLYSKNNKKLQELLLVLQEYDFHETKQINLN